MTPGSGIADRAQAVTLALVRAYLRQQLGEAMSVLRDAHDVGGGVFDQLRVVDAVFELQQPVDQQLEVIHRRRLWPLLAVTGLDGRWRRQLCGRQWQTRALCQSFNV
eukprot:47371-Eustigmatos_ZCMA.PRE.1